MSSTENDTAEKKRTHTGHRIFVIALVALLALTTLGAVVIQLSDDKNDKGEGGGPDGVVGDASMDEETRQRWATYLESAPTLDIGSPEVDARWLDGGELEFLDSIPETAEGDNLSGEDDLWEYGGDGAPSDSKDINDQDREATEDGDPEEREVEEADIIKVVNDRLFLLNNYRGFMIVNIEDPDRPVVESRLPIIGHPVSMYIVDFLAFVIVSGTPGEDEAYGDWNSGTLYIVDIETSPRVVQMVALNGYPVDSRRVGEVLYIVSYYEDHYYYREGDVEVVDSSNTDIFVEERETSSKESGSESDYYEDEAGSSEVGSATQTRKGSEIVSISFSDPGKVGEVDREDFDERSENIHVTNKAIFVSGSYYDHGPGWSPIYTTMIRYVDISDPKGDIRIKDSIEVEGQLRDRYQMDFHDGMLRVVTQIPKDPLWVSMLNIIDCRDPGDLGIEGELLIDDAGSLMATRFAGDRAYTIHLPYSVDPLDVLDLSDPSDPRLCDVLEIPGWVEHMEVRGYKIIAIGVDDTGDEWKVAVSLFDVTDPYNAQMTSRVIIGEGHTYSEANWDDKALTILDDENLILVPYSSHKWEEWESNTYGVQLVSYDLEEGTLMMRGAVEGSYPVQRTRMVDGTMITTSDKAIQTIDPTDPDKPVIRASLDLVTNIVDIIELEEHLITCSLPLWGSSGAGFKVTAIDTPGTIVEEYGPEGLVQEVIQVSEKTVLIGGIRPSEDGNATMEIYSYDISDPTSVVERPPYTRELDLGGYLYYRYYNVPQWQVLDDGGVVLFEEPYYYYYPYYYNDVEIKGEEPGVEEEIKVEYHLDLVTWTEGSGPTVTEVPWNASRYINTLYGSSDEFIVISNSYWSYYYYGQSSSATRVKVSDGIVEVGPPLYLSGKVRALSDNLTIAYTTYSWWDEVQTNSLNGYDISGDVARLIFSLALDRPAETVYLDDDTLITTGGNYWYYPYYRDTVVYDEGDGYYQESEPRTVLTVLDLSDGVPESRHYAEVDGYYYGTVYDDGCVLLQNGYKLVGLDINSRDDLDPFGSWLVPGYVQDALVLDDQILISMGYYGLQNLEK